jgi:hypothetical protein
MLLLVFLLAYCLFGAALFELAWRNTKKLRTPDRARDE